MTIIGLMTATLEVAKVALSFLPNIELVSLFIILFTIYFGKRVYFSVFVFTLIEGFLYGFGIWWFSYLYLWPLLALLTSLLKKDAPIIAYAILSGFYGLSFGALCSIPYFFIGGLHMGITYWITGIPFDLIHGVSNTILFLVLFIPLQTVLKKLPNMIE